MVQVAIMTAEKVTHNQAYCSRAADMTHCLRQYDKLRNWIVLETYKCAMHRPFLFKTKATKIFFNDESRHLYIDRARKSQ